MTPAQKAAARLGAKRRALLKAARKARAPVRRAAQEREEAQQKRFREAMLLPRVCYRVVWTPTPR